MKKIMVLAVLIMTLVVSCSYLEEKEQRERGVECRYGKRGGLENCRYIN